MDVLLSIGLTCICLVATVRKIEQLEHNQFKCYVGRLELLGFEVEPVCEFSVESSDNSCTLHMNSATLEGSRILKTARFTATMSNTLNWGETPETDLSLDTNLMIDLEMYTMPFRLMPRASVEAPGNSLLRSVLKRMQPMFLQSLITDFSRWQADKRRAQLEVSVAQESVVDASS